MRETRDRDVAEAMQAASDTTAFFHLPRQGPIEGKERTERVLFVTGYEPSGASTVPETAAYIQTLSRFPVTVLNIDEHRYGDHPTKFHPSFDLNDFSAIIFHSVMSYHPENIIGIDMFTTTKLRDFAGVKVLMKQDDNHKFRLLRPFLRDTPFDLILTLLPPEAIPRVYPPDEVGAPRFERMLTGYVTPTLRRIGRAARQRPIDIGYRGSIMPLWFGRLCYDKHRIGTEVERRLAGRGMKLDISSRAEDRFGGDAWFDFLLSCKATLGTESGGSIFDLQGDLAERLSAIEADLGPPRVEDEGYAEAYLARLSDLEDNVRYGQVSPRHFEAAAYGALQILHEGEYSGIFSADRHYFSLKKDYSNLAEAVDLLRDERRRMRVADAAYEEVILDRRYWIETFVARLDQLIYDAAEAKGQLRRTTLRRPAASHVLHLSSGDPAADVRSAWLSECAPPGLCIHRIGVMADGAGSVAGEDPGTGPFCCTVRRMTADQDLIAGWARLFDADQVAGYVVRELAFIAALSALPDETLAFRLSAPPHSARLGAFREALNRLLDTTQALVEDLRHLRGPQALIAADLSALPAALILGGAYGARVLYDASIYMPDVDPAAQEFERQFWLDLEARLLSLVSEAQAPTVPMAEWLSGYTGRTVLAVQTAAPRARAGIARTGRGTDRCVFLCPGAADMVPGALALIAAWPKVDPRAHLIVTVPVGEPAEVLRHCAVHSGVADRIAVRNASWEQFFDLCGGADVGILPNASSSVTQRLSGAPEMSLYMAAGLPILLNEHYHLGESLAKAACARSVNFRHERHLVDAVDGLTGRPDVRQALGASGLRRFLDEFHWERQAVDFYDRLAAMMSGRPAASLERRAPASPPSGAAPARDPAATDAAPGPAEPEPPEDAGRAEAVAPARNADPAQSSSARPSSGRALYAGPVYQIRRIIRRIAPR